MEIVPDPILIAVQTVPFIVTLIALHFIIFKPMLAFLQEREGISSGGWKEARALEAVVAEKLTTHEAQLTAARSEVIELLAKRRADAAADYDELVADARTQADAQVLEAVNRIHSERDAASASLAESSKHIADQIASQVLGRGLAGSPA